MSCCCNPFGPAAGGAGLSNVFWVDAAAPAGGDGTDERPFNTVTTACATVPDGSTLLICAGDYTAEATIALTKSLNFWGQGDGEDVLLPGFTWAAGLFINFKSCTVDLSGVNDAEIGMWDTFATSVGENCLALFELHGGSFSGNYLGLTAEQCDLRSGIASAFVATVSANHCDLGDVTTTGGSMTLLDCDFPAGGALEAAAILMDRVTERRAAVNGASPSVLPTPLEPINPIFGSGATGSVLLNAGSVLLNPSDEYDNLTLQGTGAVRCENSILRVRNLLDISSVNASAIRDYSGGGGSAAVGAAGGGAWGGVGGSTQGNSGTLQAPSGANGIVGVGAQATNVPTLANAFGGKGGGSGAGGAGAAGAGGAARAAAAVTNERVTPHWPIVFSGPSNAVTAGSAVTAPVPIMGGHVGQAGSSGAGDAGGAGNAGGGGGGAGRGGGSVVVYARGIQLGAGTTAGAITAAGQAGGAGGNGAGGNSGGGGGGAGGGGGLVLIAYEWIIGSQPAGDEVTASGGAGAVGGNGTGTGGGGNGGDGGAGGQIVFWNLLTNTRTIVLGAAGGAGGAAVGTAGGAAGTAGVCTADFP